MKVVVLGVDGFDALYLVDSEGVEHKEAAAMGVLRPTFSRILSDVRHVVAKVLVGGQALRIEGGSYQLTRAAVSAAVAFWDRVSFPVNKGHKFKAFINVMILLPILNTTSFGIDTPQLTSADTRGSGNEMPTLRFGKS